MLRTASGDEHAFMILVNRHQKDLYNFFLRSTASAEDAEDLTQQLFINLHRNAGRYKRGSSFRTYIFRIAANLAISHARKRKKAEHISLEKMIDEGMPEIFAGDDDGPSRYAENRELMRRYLGALEGLPDDWRTIMDLRVKEGFSYREIARFTGKSVASVESIIFRARERLARELEEFRKK